MNTTNNWTVEQEARSILNPKRGSVILNRMNTGNIMTLVNAAWNDGAETLILVPDARRAVDREEDLDYFFNLYSFQEVQVKHRPYLAKFNSGGRISVRVCDENNKGYKGANPHVILYHGPDFEKPETVEEAVEKLAIEPINYIYQPSFWDPLITIVIALGILVTLCLLFSVFG